MKPGAIRKSRRRYPLFWDRDHEELSCVGALRAFLIVVVRVALWNDLSHHWESQNAIFHPQGWWIVLSPLVSVMAHVPERSSVPPVGRVSRLAWRLLVILARSKFLV